MFEEEPPEIEDSLLNSGKLLVTPHTAWVSEESEKELRKKATKQVKQALIGETPDNVVNTGL